MEKENGETGGGDGGGRESKGSDASSLLDAASLFGAYWGRDPSALLGGAYGGAGGAGGFSMLGGAGGGSGSTQGGGGRYPPNSTLSVAASQAASLGLHPAASAAWWSMASQLAAQDYLARLQASGLGGFPPGQDPYSLAAGLAAAQQQQQAQAQAQQQRQGGARGRPAGQRGQQHRGQNKDKDKNMIPTSASSNSPYAANCGNVSLANMEGLLYYGSQYGMPKTSSPSMSSSLGMPSGLSSMAGLNSLAGSRTPTLSSASPQPLLSSSSSKHSRKSSSSAAAKASALSGAYLAGVSSKGGSPAPSQGQSAAAKEKEQLMMRGDLLMAQAYQQAVQGKNSSALFGNPFGLAGMNASGLSDKDRHSGLDSLANLPHTILSDGASILGGVRLPPDTEIIKYTSSIVGPKVRKVPGTTNRGRKKTISLDPPHVSVLPALSSTGLQLERGGPAKRPKLDSEYGHLPMAHQNSSSAAASSASGSDRVEVIKLPSGASDPRSSTPFSMSGYTGLSKELLQSIANQSGLNLAALEKQFAEQFGGSSSYSRSSSQYPSYATNSTAQDTGLNLSSKPSQQPAQPHRDESPASTVNEDDAPLNLSLKPSTTSRSSEKDWKSSGREGSSSRMRDHDETASALSSLSSITASLGARAQPQPPSRVSRRKPGAKPRRVIQESSPSPSQPQGQESPTPSGSEDSDMGPWHSTKEGRPRNLGRGVSKPKKNTVASLLAQSRALGIRPALAHQYLQEAADLLNPELQEKLKAAMGDMAAGLGGVMPAELSATDSDGALSDSGADDSDGSDALAAEPMLRLPLAMGWRRETLMKGLSKNGSIKGDVTYCPPEPHSNIKLKSIQELTNYLEKSPCPPLQKENFSFSSRPLIGRFLQVGGQEGMSETEVAKRLEEARRALGTAGGVSSLAVEQRIELARQQQAAREARKDQAKGREQARLAREQERSERAEQARRDKEYRSLQLLEAQLRHADRNTKILNANEKTTIGFWKNIQAIASSSTSHRPISVSMPSMSLTLTPVSTQQHPANPPTQNQWKDYEYNALDKIKCFAESAAMNFSPTKSKLDAKKDFKLIPVKQEPKPHYKSNAVSVIKVTNPKVHKEDLMSKILDSYSRMGEFVSGQCDWTKETLDLAKAKTSADDLKVLEEKYLSAKNNYMSSNLMLMPNLLSPHKPEVEAVKATESIEVIDLVDNEDEDFVTMDSSSTEKVSPEKEMPAEALAARRKRQEDLEKQRQEDQSRKQQERELKRQQAVMIKEQLYMAEVGKQRELIYTVELERERRRQHMSLVKQLDGRRRYEDRERRKHRLLLDKLSLKEKKLEQRKKELELLKELRKPQEDSTLSDQKPLPTFNRIPGLKLPGQAMADIMMVFEFIHNFGMTLGFDMESLPTLNTLQMSLLPDCCTDAEEELVSILTHLLVCAIEDPGIPHPGRHTTILGQTLRSNEITPANVSEVLRIYLYANATGEIKAMTGINVERDREKRVADHHQSDAESLQSSCNGRNVVYYSHLHANPTWRLADKLRRRPYLALNPTSKARILALLCDELLQSKAVLRQIDASLESLSQMKKERYLMDAKLRKIKMMHSRKLRLENAEKQQALALERMQRMVEESEMAAVSAANSILNTPNSHPGDSAMDISSAQDAINSMDDKMLVNDVTGEITEKPDDVNHDDVHELEDSALMGAPPASQYLKESAAKDALAMAKEQQHLDLKANGAKDNTDKDSVAGDAELMLSDVESEGTQPEEDEDKNLPAEELARKLDKLIRQSDAQLQSLAAGAHSLRATCYGQDRYWRRYWSLGKCGGVYVEAMESSQPEIVAYHERMEEGAKRKDEEEAACKAAGRRNARNKKGQKAKAEEAAQEVNNLAKNSERLLQNELELRSIKSELNLGDHTRIIKYEPNMGHNKVQGSPIKMEEKHIQQQKVAEDHLLDIEDSIPTAFLVQKPQSEKRNVYAMNEVEENSTNAEIKQEPNIKMETNSDGILDLGIKSESKDGIITNNLEELKKLADSVVSPKENNTEVDVKLENIAPEKIKDETNDPEVAANMLTAKMAEGKWFSILRKENPLADSAHANGIEDSKDFKSLDGIVNQMNGGLLSTSTLHANPVYTDNTQTCSEVILSQGNRWDVCNNLNLLTNPSLLFSSNSGQTQAPVLNTFYHADCTLTMSGLDEEMIDPKQEVINESSDQINIENGLKDVSMNHLDSLEPGLNLNSIENSDPEKTPVKCGAPKSKAASVASSTTTNGNMLGGVNNSNCQLGIAGMNLSALTSYVSCESPAPLQMTQEESEQLEYCKLNGLPKKLDGNYVPKDLRHGWWKVTDVDQLKETLAKLHPRGVRERELHNSFLMGLVQTNNKLTIEKGDLLATELSISHLDRVIALNGGFPSPDSSNSFSVKTARRIDGSLLEQIEALEDRVAAASMQIKGWKPPPRTCPSPSSTPPRDGSGETGPAVARARLLQLEAAIERRYLRPPLGAGAPVPTQEAPQQPQVQEEEDQQDARGATIPRGLATWREGTARCQTSAQLAMVLHALEAAIAWDKSIMKANCQFCQSGDSEDKLLLCDGCDKGYHTYCFKPKMEKIPDGDWYCYECLNKATGDRVCIVCGGKGGAGCPSGRGGRLVPCALCPRAYHPDCHYPPLSKVPRGKWYCVKCVTRAPPKKPRSAKKPKQAAQQDNLSDTMQPPSPAPSQASTTTTEDCAITSALLNQSSLSSVQSTPEKHFQPGSNSATTDPGTGTNTKQHFAAINNSLNSTINDMETTPDKNLEAVNDSMEYTESNDKDNIYNADESGLSILEDSKNDTTATAANVDDSCYDFKELEDLSVDGESMLNNSQENNSNSIGKLQLRQQNNTSKAGSHSEDGGVDGEVSCGTVEGDSNSGNNSEDYKGVGNETMPASPREREGRHSAKKDRGSHKRLNKELALCKALLEEMEIHDDSWPFLLPVNTKQFPTYKKVIRAPMDLSTIKRKLQDCSYKTKEEFAGDVRQIFHNCEVFNEDESPVGRAGHGMRRFFEERWSSV